MSVRKKKKMDNITRAIEEINNNNLTEEDLHEYTAF
jgi:DNA-directed RNA polymerase subunit K/omega